jgi:hypothetical protein
VIDAARCQQALLETAKVSQLELVSIYRRVLRRAYVNASYPMAAPLQRRDEMVTDEAASASDQCARITFRSHLLPPLSA